MSIVMIRNFDHAGYYETRLLLMIVAFAVALFFLIKRNDRNYLVMFLSGAFWQGFMELILKLMGLRGDFILSVFGLTLPQSILWIYQGFAEGGIHAVMGYWFFDLYLNRNEDFKQRRNLYLATLLLVLIFSLTVGYLAQGKEITSVRPMFRAGPIMAMLYVTFITLIIAGLKGGELYRYCAIYFVGTFIYFFINLEPLQPLGVRYIGLAAPDGELQTLSSLKGFFVMLYSHIWEGCGSRFHYFVIVYVLGFLKLQGSRK